MFALIPVFLRSAAVFIFSSAAAIVSLGFYKRPTGTTSINSTLFEAFKLGIYALVILFALKLGRDLIK